jgi:hypothetical protein
VAWIVGDMGCVLLFGRIFRNRPFSHILRASARSADTG